MNIECPKCNQTNAIEFSEHISCNHCSTNFKGFNFVKKKITAIAAIGTMALGAVGGYEINDSLNSSDNPFNASSEHRYPLEIEYALVDTCVNGRSMLFPKGRHKEVRNQCLCVIEFTTKQISYNQYKNDIDAFNNSIQYAVPHCKN